MRQPLLRRVLLVSCRAEAGCDTIAPSLTPLEIPAKENYNWRIDTTSHQHIGSGAASTTTSQHAARLCQPKLCKVRALAPVRELPVGDERLAVLGPVIEDVPVDEEDEGMGATSKEGTASSTSPATTTTTTTAITFQEYRTHIEKQLMENTEAAAAKPNAVYNHKEKEMPYCQFPRQ